MNVAAIPAELRERRQWVCWRFEQREGKQTKPPWRVDGSAHASADDPASWGSFEEALETLEAGKVDGLGYVFAADDPFCGVDLDRCRNGSGLHPDAAAIVLRLDSYTEWSPSGGGVHVLLRGRLPGSRRRKGQVEMYDRARFFCVTGEHLRGTRQAIEERQRELEQVYEALFPASAAAVSVAVEPLDLDDEELLEKIRSSAQGAKFEALWEGRWENLYGSQSEADLALASMLAFWTRADAVRMDSLFRRSGLMRDKWGACRGESSYGEQTIARALEGVSEVYRPARPRPSPSSRPDRVPLGTQTPAAPGEKGENRDRVPRPDVYRDAGRDAAVLPRRDRPDLRFVAADQFAAVEEPGADALVGDAANVLVPESGDVMFYGDGGAGKTTLMLDLGVHLAAGDDWLGIEIERPRRVAIIENEGPRPLFRAKLRRKLAAWTGSPFEGRLLQLEEPWSKVSLDDPAVCEALAAAIGKLELDALLLGPVTRSGMNEAGTLQQVRDYVNLIGAIRDRSGRRVTLLLAHHENRRGQVSGAWEGAVDTLFHVQAQGHGQTRLFVQKARWSPAHHKQKLQLGWAEGESFEVLAAEERDDNEIADEILAFVHEHGGSGWNKVDQAVAGKSDRLRSIRDGLLEGGRLVNRGSEARMKLWHAEDPALPLIEEGGEEPA